MSSSPLRHNEKQRIRTITLLLSPNRGVEGGLLKTAARKETKVNFMLVEVESMCVCVVCACLCEGCDCAQAQWEVAWKLAGVAPTT
jgi:hypothetical protein